MISISPAATAAGEVQALMSGPSDEQASDWSRDGKHIIAAVRGEETRFDIWRLERTESGEWESHVFLETEFDEGEAKLSPDGRYIAYVSGESGQAEIYVQPFPSGGRKVTVSTNGGVQPRWSRDGSELFYVEGRGCYEGVDRCFRFDRLCFCCEFRNALVRKH